MNAFAKISHSAIMLLGAVFRVQLVRRAVKYFTSKGINVSSDSPDFILLEVDFISQDDMKYPLLL